VEKRADAGSDESDGWVSIGSDGHVSQARSVRFDDNVSVHSGDSCKTRLPPDLRSLEFQAQQAAASSAAQCVPAVAEQRVPEVEGVPAVAAVPEVEGVANISDTVHEVRDVRDDASGWYTGSQKVAEEDTAAVSSQKADESSEISELITPAVAAAQRVNMSTATNSAVVAVNEAQRVKGCAALLSQHARRKTRFEVLGT